MGNRNLIKNPENQVLENHQGEDENNKTIIEYNNKTYRQYIGKGLTPPDMLDYQERQFVANVDFDPKIGHNIKRTVTKIVRLKAPDYSNEKRISGIL
ncbi:MAG TPA: hypothetical protein VFV86_06745 [Nitrososphaeraceae archaeon]|nr:hypothetical protein [Nitrososphaeraceae archaeon]